MSKDSSVDEYNNDQTGDVGDKDKQHLEFEGTVIFDTKGCFKVKLPSGQEINAKPSGKMRKHKIQIITGDIVRVACSIYDPLNGFITHRLTSSGGGKNKNNQNGGNKNNKPKTTQTEPRKYDKERDWK